MDATSRNWRPMGEPATPAEAAALDATRKLLPDSGVVAWSNVFLTDLQGESHEIDLILLTRVGLFLCELKGYHGAISGSQQFWTITRQGGRREEVRNPLGATDRKAKRLKSLLADAAGPSSRVRPVPFVQPIVVLHGEDSTVDLTGPAVAHLYGLPGYRVKGVPALTLLLTGKAADASTIDSSQFHETGKLFDRLGMRSRPKVRMIGQYRVDSPDPIGVGPGWQDYAVDHPSIANHRRRVRIYNVPSKAPETQRNRIARAARREYLLTNSLVHPGITSAQELINDPEAPAVVFPAEPDARPLDVWLTEHADELTLAGRLGVVRDIAEALVFAHRHGVTHRALSPTAVYVEGAGGGRRVSVRDWQAGAAGTGDPDTGQDYDGGAAADTALHGTTHVADLADQRQLVYLAPEAHTVTHPDGQAMDVYGLGALTFLLLTGRDPAANLAELQQVLTPGTGLNPSVAIDGVPEDLAAAVALATAPVASERLTSVDDFLAELTAVERGLSEQAAEPSRVVDPLEADVGSVLIDDAGGEWIVEDRLGSGSTGRALLVSSGESGAKPCVLKVAVDQSKAQRLIDEAEVLARLDHHLIVKVLREPFRMAGRTCVLLENAGSQTLGQLLRRDGRLTWEQLESFSADLFQAVTYLAAQGVHHRDIKPDNFAIRPDPSSRKPRLVMFDFSLSTERISNIASGTTPYLDPFLGAARGRPSYDSAAERYAIAVTLFEMAAGYTPTWGDGQSDPAVINEPATVSSEMFEGPSPVAVADFFRRALDRAARNRFGDIEQMAREWHRMFSGTTTTALGVEMTDEDRDAAAAGATETTGLADAGLTPNAVSAARRLGAETVGDVLGWDPVVVNRTPGVGVRTRQELQQRRKRWLAALRQSTWVQDAQLVGRSVDELRASLVPRANGQNSDAIAVAAALLDAPDWPTLRHLAAAARVEQSAAATAMAQLRKFWARNAGVREVSCELQDFLSSTENVATLAEVAMFIVGRHGSRLDDPAARSTAALALIRAAIESRDAGGTDNSVVISRNPDRDSPDTLLIALARPDVTAVMAALRTLADRLDEATRDEPIVIAGDAAVLAAPVTAAFDMSMPRALRLAALVSADTDASTRSEAYRVGIPGQVSVPRVLQGAGSSVLSVETLAERVRRRYPKAAALPTRPSLDAIVAGAIPGMAWRDGRYTRAQSGSGLASATRSTMLAADTDQDARDATARLRSSLRTRSGLVIAVSPRHLDTTAAVLARRFEVTPVSIAAKLIDAAKLLAADKNVQWDFLLRVDAQREGADHAQMRLFMQNAAALFWDDLLARDEPVLLTDAAILARYNLEDLLAPISDLSTALPAARWILVPRHTSSFAPMLDSVALPLGADGWLDLPTTVVVPEMAMGA